MTSQRHVSAMVALTFATGIVDAVGYLGLDRVFTGNMTGNVALLGMGLTGAHALPVAGPLLALGGFLAGAATAGRALRGGPTGWSSRTTVLLGAVAALLALLAVLLLASSSPGRPVVLAITFLLALAMGLQAGTARGVGVRDVTTVVVTSALTGLAADSRWGAGTGAQFGRRGTAVAALLAGAALGALLLRWQAGGALLLAAAVTSGVTALGSSQRTAA